jgi:hypothetical protein
MVVWIFLAYLKIHHFSKAQIDVSCLQMHTQHFQLNLLKHYLSFKKLTRTTI